MIKLLLEIKSSFLSRKVRCCLKLLALEVDVNLLNQHCKKADWLADWLTYWCISTLKAQKTLSHSNTWGTQGTWALKGHLGTRALKALETLKEHSKGTQGTQGGRKALGHLRHSGTQMMLRHSRHLATWPLRHLGTLPVSAWWTQALEGHLGTQAVEALEALYLAHLSKRPLSLLQIMKIMAKKGEKWRPIISNMGDKKPSVIN